MKNKYNKYQNICDVNLHKKTKREYGETYRDHFLEQYKVAIQGVDYTSKWKHIVNNYFLTIHTVLLAAIGLSVARDQVSIQVVTHQLIPVIGLFMAMAWWFMTRNYNDVLAAKFYILHCIEEHLPLAVYKTEWEIMKESYDNPYRAAFIDATVPFLFFVFYILIIFFVK